MICQSPSNAAVRVCPLTGGGCLTTVVNVPVGTTVTGCPVGQGLALTAAEFTALKAAATSSSPSAGASITVQDAFGTATPEQYQAISLVFGAVLAAASLIWAAKRLLYVFRHPSES